MTQKKCRFADASRITSKHENTSQLQFYPPAVCDIIERAKQISHSELGSINSFPLRTQFNTKALTYMNKAIAERCKAGLIIPGGR
ncbi:hypothetical protein JVT61DRAFT_14887 [Boletus reticuloceps]|uniref:Uncharacterized protein n=1 Tax=Boletus reticuloceps TaxID=495285 RepID=A0A8I2YCH3_9AGAM|nr:hypothetical protein JVT61DRAFT_14887 [Boletus reticuloceps]